MKKTLSLLLILIFSSTLCFGAQVETKLVDNNGRSALYGSTFTTATLRLPSGPQDTKPIQIATASTKACTIVITPIQPIPTDCIIYIGGSNCATATGFGLTSGYLYLNLTNPSTLYARGSAYTPSISYILITE